MPPAVYIAPRQHRTAGQLCYVPLGWHLVLHVWSALEQVFCNTLKGVYYQQIKRTGGKASLHQDSIAVSDLLKTIISYQNQVLAVWFEVWSKSTTLVYRTIT